MLIVKGNIYRNVSENEAEKYKSLGYKEVEGKPIKKRGADNGDSKH